MTGSTLKAVLDSLNNVGAAATAGFVEMPAVNKIVKRIEALEAAMAAVALILGMKIGEKETNVTTSGDPGTAESKVPGERAGNGWARLP